ncbi:H-NS histone family protein [Robbsia andropogonis]|uniref:H-NS histone family protein n=1 Tax=Robbsia andropogonis TaxID=28092 RepID=UPI001588D4DB|nr:H-NS histone family protein [Robbsia andropogonis]
MNLEALLSRREALNKEIAQQIAAQRNDALAEVRKTVALFGFTIAELDVPKPKKSKLKNVKTQPIYRDPETGWTWSGRGKPPKWIAGKDYDQFLIQRTS